MGPGYRRKCAESAPPKKGDVEGGGSDRPRRRQEITHVTSSKRRGLGFVWSSTTWMGEWSPYSQRRRQHRFILIPPIIHRGPSMPHTPPIIIYAADGQAAGERADAGSLLSPGAVRSANSIPRLLDESVVLWHRHEGDLNDLQREQLAQARASRSGARRKEGAGRR